jgi:hypothetical protein
VKFQNMIRKGLVFAGFSAALVLLPGSVSAQEITNAEFSDDPNVAAFAQPAASPNSTATAAVTLASQSAEVAHALPPMQQPPDQQESSDNLLWTGAMLVWVGGIGIYLYGPAKRLTQQISQLRSAYTSTTE